jgi:hypothetical protein
MGRVYRLMDKRHRGKVYGKTRIQYLNTQTVFVRLSNGRIAETLVQFVEALGASKTSPGLYYAISSTLNSRICYNTWYHEL